MRKLVVLTFVSLDGVMQAPGGPTEDTSGGFKYGGWTVPFFDEFSAKVMAEQMSKPFDLLLGRKTYEIFATYWPHITKEKPEYKIAVLFNQCNKFVASHQSMHFTWQNSILLKGNVAKEIKKLKNQNGPDLQVYGSGNLIQTLLKNDLVDELWLKIFPVTLGSGKRLFAEGTMPAGFRLIESKVSPSGVIVASYAREGNVKTGSF